VFLKQKHVCFFIEREKEELSCTNAVVKPFFLQVKKNEKLKSRKNLFLDAGDVTFCTIWRFYPKSWISRPCIEITFCEKWFTKGSVNFRGTFFTEHLTFQSFFGGCKEKSSFLRSTVNLWKKKAYWKNLWDCAVLLVNFFFCSGQFLAPHREPFWRNH
jgi:hypothetical protein